MEKCCAMENALCALEKEFVQMENGCALEKFCAMEKFEKVQ